MELTGTEELTAFFKKKQDITPEVEKTVKDCAVLLRNEIVRNSHVDTGAMRLSTDVNQVNGSTFEVGQKEEYAPHENFGHRTKNGGYVEGHHQVTNAVEKVKPIFNSKMERLAKK